MFGLTPARRRGREILDDPAVDADTRVRSLRDVTISNALFGGRRSALAAVMREASGPGALTLADIGTGGGDIPRALRRKRPSLRTLGIDEAADLLAAHRDANDQALCARLPELPLRDRSVDIVLCSQLLHHFADDDLGPAIRELDRIARQRVIVADIRRSWLAAAGFWIASVALRFHPVTRHDGVVSVFRGFTATELKQVIERSTGVSPTVRRHLGFRLTATWQPRPRSSLP